MKIGTIQTLALQTLAHNGNGICLKCQCLNSAVAPDSNIHTSSICIILNADVHESNIGTSNIGQSYGYYYNADVWFMYIGIIQAMADNVQKGIAD